MHLNLLVIHIMRELIRVCKSSRTLTRFAVPVDIITSRPQMLNLNFWFWRHRINSLKRKKKMVKDQNDVDGYINCHAI